MHTQHIATDPQTGQLSIGILPDRRARPANRMATGASAR